MATCSTYDTRLICQTRMLAIAKRLAEFYESANIKFDQAPQQSLTQQPKLAT